MIVYFERTLARAPLTAALIGLWAGTSAASPAARPFQERDFPPSLLSSVQASALGRWEREGRSYVVLMNRLPNRPIDLRAPQSLQTMLNLRLLTGSLDAGHASFGWSCAVNGRRSRNLIAITGESSWQSVRMIRAGWGLTPLVSTFTDGRLEHGPEFEEDVYYFNEPEEARHYAFVAVEVPGESCGAAMKFAADFEAHPRAATRFGSVVDPLKFEGGGCVSFENALAAHAGIFPNSREAWARRYQVPVRLLGKGPVDARGVPIDVDGQPIPAVDYSVLRGLTPSRWPLVSLLNEFWTAVRGERAIEVAQIDPELVDVFYREIGRAILRSGTQAGADRKLMRDARARMERTRWTVTMDGSQVDSAPTATPIDEDFDVYAGGNVARVASSVRAELAAYDLGRSEFFAYPKGVGIALAMKGARERP